MGKPVSFSFALLFHNLYFYVNNLQKQLHFDRLSWYDYHV